MANQRFGRVPHAIRRSGVRRTRLYQLAAKHRGLFLKDGAVTIVDLRKLDKILAALPPAEIKVRGRDGAA